jgi:hypothetical protein
VAIDVETETGNETGERNRDRSHFSWVIWLNILVVLYVLSIGPARKLQQSGILPYRLLTAYRPLEMLADRFPRAFRLLDWHVYDVWHCGRLIAGRPSDF